MISNPLLWLVLAPALAGLLCLFCVRSLGKAGGPLLVLGTLANLVLSVVVFAQPRPASLAIPFGARDWQFVLDFRVDDFAAFILLSAAVLGFLLALYAAQFMAGKKAAGPFHAFFLFTVSLLQGAVLADHLFTLLFFWEGMLLTLFGMIVVGHAGAYKTAVKAFFINGVTDLCLMAGIGIIFVLTRSLSISGLAERPLAVDGWAGLAFALLLVGAISKAGSMPFHSWIPDAAVDAPLPFMALMPGAMEKLIGIYFTARVALDIFRGVGESWAGTTMMIVGAATILLAVLMALVQKDFKRLLSFHAISQVGYMILGIGTGTTLGIVGGLFHMVNNALYKSTLFLTGGAVEQRAGTTDLRQVSGLGRAMPVTMGCFLVAAFSISGFPFTNGFYSKELVYDGALQRGAVFYLAAAVGTIFTAASFLKLGHAAFFGPFMAPRPQSEIKDPPPAMLVPMVAIAGLCLVFGLGNAIPLNQLIIPAVSRHLTGAEHIAGILPHNWLLAGGTVLALLLAGLNHWWGFKRTMSGLGAVDHLHYAPVAHQLYDAAERRWFDPYELFLKLVKLVSWAGYGVDRAIDFVYDKVVTAIAGAFGSFLREAHTGSHTAYLLWSAAAAALIVFYFVGGF